MHVFACNSAIMSRPPLASQLQTSFINAPENTLAWNLIIFQFDFVARKFLLSISFDGFMAHKMMDRTMYAIGNHQSRGQSASFARPPSIHTHAHKSLIFHILSLPFACTRTQSPATRWLIHILWDRKLIFFHIVFSIFFSFEFEPAEAANIGWEWASRGKWKTPNSFNVPPSIEHKMIEYFVCSLERAHIEIGMRLPSQHSLINIKCNKPYCIKHKWSCSWGAISLIYCLHCSQFYYTTQSDFLYIRFPDGNWNRERERDGKMYEFTIQIARAKLSYLQFNLSEVENLLSPPPSPGDEQFRIRRRKIFNQKFLFAKSSIYCLKMN